MVLKMFTPPKECIGDNVSVPTIIKRKTLGCQKTEYQGAEKKHIVREKQGDEKREYGLGNLAAARSSMFTEQKRHTSETVSSPSSTEFVKNTGKTIKPNISGSQVTERLVEKTAKSNLEIQGDEKREYGLGNLAAARSSMFTEQKRHTSETVSSPSSTEFVKNTGKTIKPNISGSQVTERLVEKTAKSNLEIQGDEKREYGLGNLAAARSSMFTEQKRHTSETVSSPSSTEFVKNTGKTIKPNISGSQVTERLVEKTAKSNLEIQGDEKREYGLGNLAAARSSMFTEQKRHTSETVSSPSSTEFVKNTGKTIKPNISGSQVTERLVKKTAKSNLEIQGDEKREYGLGNLAAARSSMFTEQKRHTSETVSSPSSTEFVKNTGKTIKPNISGSQVTERLVEKTAKSNLEIQGDEKREYGLGNLAAARSSMFTEQKRHTSETVSSPSSTEFVKNTGKTIKPNISGSQVTERLVEKTAKSNLEIQGDEKREYGLGNLAAARSSMFAKQKRQTSETVSSPSSTEFVKNTGKTIKPNISGSQVTERLVEKTAKSNLEIQGDEKREYGLGNLAAARSSMFAKQKRQTSETVSSPSSTEFVKNTGKTIKPNISGSQVTERLVEKTAKSNLEIQGDEKREYGLGNLAAERSSMFTEQKRHTSETVSSPSSTEFVKNTGKTIKPNISRSQVTKRLVKKTAKSKLKIQVTADSEECEELQSVRRSGDKKVKRGSINLAKDEAQSGTWLRGEVCSIKKQSGRTYGFIRPRNMLPDGFKRNRDVYFPLTSVCGNEIEIGDQVMFLLKSNSQKEPHALQVQVLSLFESGDEENAYDSDADVTLCEDPNNGITVNSQRHATIRKVIQPLTNWLDYAYIPPESSQHLLTGVIKTMHEGIGWMKRCRQLTGSDSENALVKFKVDHVRCANFPLKVGDTLRFRISSRKCSPPYALSTTLLECCVRSGNELLDYLSGALNSIRDCEEEASRMSMFVYELISCPAIWRCLGNAEEMTDIYVTVFMDFIVEIEKKAKNEKMAIIFGILSESRLFQPSKSPLPRYLNGRCTQLANKLVASSFSVIRMILRYRPDSSTRLVALLQAVINSKHDQLNLDTFLLSCLSELSKRLSSDSKYLPWNEKPLIPSSDELHTSPEDDFSILRPVKINEPYESCEDYYDTYFSLLRADCYSSLRTSLKALLAGNLDYRDMSVYKKVNLASLSISHDGLVIGLEVTPLKKIQNWSSCTNLMYGNLLCISPTGNFNDAIWAVVANRNVKELQRNGIIHVELCTESNSSSDAEVIYRLLCNSNAIMVESPTYHLAYKPILQSLQEFDFDRMSFKEELVEGKPCQIRPEYLQFYGEIDLLTSSCERLDSSQYEALKRVFSQRVICIQGPPGTGKTVLGVEIIRNILSLPEVPQSPVLVITYKNHALDEFLMKLLQYYPGCIARIGGRSKEEALEDCNCSVLARGWKPEHIHKPLQDINTEIYELKASLEKLSLELLDARHITLSTLTRHLTPSQKLSLLTQGKMVQNANAADLLTELERATSSPVSSEVRQRMIDGFKDWYKGVRNVVAPNTPNCTSEEPTFGNKLDNTCYDEEDIEQLENERIIVQPRPFESTFLKWTRPKDLLADIKLPRTSKDYVSQLPFVLLGITDNLYSFKIEDRALVLESLLVMQETEIKERFTAMLKRYRELCRERADILDLHKSEILASKKVIGMTVTGANIYRGLLSKIKPAVILVEEAAEIGEPHLMSLLNESVQHLILIGDHKQLRPQVENYRLVKDFSFDVSMMERLVENGIGCSTLHKQNRMHPDISKFLLDIYPSLKDNDMVVGKLEKINCVSERVFFWDHRDAEKVDRSYSNAKEADRAIKLALFFIQQGNQPSQITILAPYQGQVRLLRERFRKAKLEWPNILSIHNEHDADQGTKQVSKIEIQTIDQYQGDENDFVIVSLTRSNKEKKLGFLKVLNRRCVVQSRARRGLYYIGNSDTLKSNHHWNRMLTEMRRDQLVSNGISLVCPEHSNSSKLAFTAEDIPLEMPFCQEKCLKPLPCGHHRCNEFCQPPHKHEKCSQRCKHVCEAGHTCSKECYPAHSHKCTEEVEFIHEPCGHTGRKPCFADPANVLCVKTVHFTFTACGHIGKKKCWEKTEGKKCKNQCPKLLKCGHLCNMKCSEPCNHGSCQTCEEKRKALEEKQRTEEEVYRQKAIRKAREELEQMKDSVVGYRRLAAGDIRLKREYDEIVSLLKRSVPVKRTAEISICSVFSISNPLAARQWYQTMLNAQDPTKTVRRLLKWDVKHDLCEEKSELKIKPANGKYGQGIYLSSKMEPPDKSAGISEVLSCLIVDVIVGKVLSVKSGSDQADKLQLKDLRFRGYDSIEEDLLDETTTLVPPRYILPLYKVDYQVMILDQLGKLEAEALRQRSTDIVKHEIKPTRELAGNDPLQLQFKEAEAIFLRHLQSIPNENLYKDKNCEKSRYKVTQVDYWINPDHLQTFLDKMDDLHKRRGPAFDSYVLAFHGTNSDTESIFRNNFDMNQIASGTGDKGYYGKGFYFTEFPQTARYYGKKLILCRILPGKSYTMQLEQFKLGGKLEDGYDSHRVNIQNGEGYSEELVVFDANQILPLYEIHYCKVG